MIQFLAERSIVPVKIETDDMDILTIVFSRKLNAGNDFYWFVLGSLKRLTETIYGVVIGQSESRKMIFMACSTSCVGVSVPSEKVE